MLLPPAPRLGEERRPRRPARLVDLRDPFHLQRPRPRPELAAHDHPGHRPFSCRIVSYRSPFGGDDRLMTQLDKNAAEFPDQLAKRRGTPVGLTKVELS